MGEIDHVTLMLNQDLTGIDGVVAVEHLQDRAFADTGRAAEHDTFALLDGERYAIDDRQADAVTQVHGEAFGDFGNNEGSSHDYTCRMEETRSWV